MPLHYQYNSLYTPAETGIICYFSNVLLSDRWEKGFYYIARQKIAPVLIGEFGGRKVDAESKEGVWQRQFVEFVKRNQHN